MNLHKYRAWLSNSGLPEKFVMGPNLDGYHADRLPVFGTAIRVACFETASVGLSRRPLPTAFRLHMLVEAEDHPASR